MLFCYEVMSDSLGPHGLQHTRLLCHYLPEFAQTHIYESVIISNCLILCCSLLLPSIIPIIRVFSNEWALHIKWLKYWSFSSTISPSNEYTGLISFSSDWFGFLSVQGTLKNLQNHNLKASLLQHSAFFMVQLSHSNMLGLLSRFSHVRLCATPQTAAHQALLSLGLSRQKHWSGLPFPSPMRESEKWEWSRSVMSDS